jgi:hypothetical protein
VFSLETKKWSAAVANRLSIFVCVLAGNKKMVCGGGSARCVSHPIGKHHSHNRENTMTVYFSNDTP